MGSSRALRLDDPAPSCNQPIVSQLTTTPAAEVVVDTETVRGLLRAQHPDLSDLPLQETASGWDNFIFRLGEGMSVRLPRRLASVAMLEHEQRWLPAIAPQLPVPVPALLRMGKPGDQYPWPWSIVPWLSGETADLAPLTADQSKPLARLLRALPLRLRRTRRKVPQEGSRFSKEQWQYKNGCSVSPRRRHSQIQPYSKSGNQP